MVEVIFCKLNTRPRTNAELQAIVDQLKNIVNSLLETALVSVQNGNRIEYKIGTGQTTQEVRFTSPKQVTDAIEHYERLIQIYANKMVSRKVRLTDSKNFYRR